MKKKIGLLAKSWNGENLDKFLLGLRDVWGDDADIFVFTSHATVGMGEIVRPAENSIYMLPDYSMFDAVILFGSGMSAEEFRTAVLKKCREANVPVIQQGVETDEVSTVTINNYAGMKSLCDHLIEQHQVKNAVFIGGTTHNEDSNLRRQALQDSLEAHGYSLKEDQVVYANWERMHVQEYLTENFSHGEKLPDAFVCANDITALFALMTLERLGIRCPEDVIVTGFDNLIESVVFSPSISSVDQRYREQGNACAKLTMELMKDKKINRKIVIPCKAAPGESCGCKNCKNETEVRRGLAHDVMCLKFDGDSFRSRQSRMEMCIMSSRNYVEIPDRIQADFFDFYMESTDWDNTLQICVDPAYAKLAYMEKEPTIFGEDNFSPVMDVLAAKTNGVLHSDRTLKREDLLIGYNGKGPGRTYVFNALRIGATLVGFLALEHSANAFSDHKYFEFALTISTALEKYQSNIKLVSMNARLSELMEKDSLTSVKNRVAYDSYMKKMKHMDLTESDKPVSIVMCDINNLKTINDSLGHDAGDVYIKNCCKLMETIFTHSSIFRTGGDEFVILIGEEDYADRYEHLGRMRARMDELALSDLQQVDKVSVATGLSDYDPAADKSLLDVVKRADAFMYMNKTEMKLKRLL
ncbi:MAG: GGDEF domain-containing protein [Clostridiales bacterium]|nr:GGDEF domain-containing protein [Candidatus Blautia equi]